MLRARVRPEIVGKLDEIADRIGVPRSTVVAYGIGEYAARMYAQMGLQDRMMDFLSEFGKEAMTKGLGPDEEGSGDD
jgi:predicted transcriptional regulator